MRANPLLGATTHEADPSLEAAPSVRAAHHRHRTVVTVDDQVKRLTRELDLDVVQQSAVKNILAQRRQETLHIMRDGQGTDPVGRFQQLQVTTVERIRGVLNEEQKKRYHPLDQSPLPASPQPSVEDWMKAAAAH